MVNFSIWISNIAYIFNTSVAIFTLPSTVKSSIKVDFNDGWPQPAPDHPLLAWPTCPSRSFDFDAIVK
jgi:hypothetical protein